jgi:hypothetical protein
MDIVSLDGGYVASALKARQIDQAFPLVHTIAPELPLAQWRAFATAMVDASGDPPRGIVALQTRQGYIVGLFSWMVDDHLRHGRVLTVENFVVVDLFDLEGAAGHLLEAMEPLAVEHRCQAIHTALPEAYSSLAERANQVLGRFRDLGHQLGTLHFCKPLAPETA